VSVGKRRSRRYAIGLWGMGDCFGMENYTSSLASCIA